MVRKSSPHVHTNLVDGLSPAIDTIMSAKSRGFYSLGFSEHARQKFDERYGMTPESERRYINEIKELSDEFKNDIIIALGLERDEFSICDRSEYGYIIGSKHYISDESHERFFAVDSDKETVVKGCESFFSSDWYALCDRYFSELADYIVDFKPQILGHFDLVSKLNEKNAFFNAGDAHYISSGFSALDRIIGVNPLMEINTGAMARGYRTSPYPSMDFLKHWREIGGEIILSTDCHDAAKIDFGLEVARDLAINAGYERAWCICSQMGEFEPYEL